MRTITFVTEKHVAVQPQKWRNATAQNFNSDRIDEKMKENQASQTSEETRKKNNQMK